MFQYSLNGLLIKLNRNTSLLLMKRTKGYVNDASFRISFFQFSEITIIKMIASICFHEV